MARYTGPATRKSRRLGVDLVGGDQSFEKRPYPPGEHGRARRRTESDYAVRLREKQRLRAQYALREKQLAKAYENARKAPGLTGEALVEDLDPGRWVKVGLGVTTIYLAGIGAVLQALPRERGAAGMSGH